MQFFKKESLEYFDEFSQRHRQFCQSYINPFGSFKEIYHHISYDTARCGYFLWQGIQDSSKSLYSLCSSLYQLFTFSFTGAWQSLKDSAFNFSASITKHAFGLVSTCLSFIQFTTKLISSLFISLGAMMYTLSNFFFGKSNDHSNESKKLLRELDELQNTLNKILEEKEFIHEEIKFFSNEINLQNLSLSRNPRVYKHDSSKEVIGQFHMEFKKLSNYLEGAIKSYPEYNSEIAENSHAINNFRERFEEHHALVRRTATAYFQSCNEYLKNVDQNTIEVSEALRL